MRLFTAIELPKQVREHLLHVKAEMSSHTEPSAVSWVKPDNLHVTLKFLGEVPDAAVGRLGDALGRVRVDPMRLAADHLVVFPIRGPVRVIAVGFLGDVERLGELFRQVEDACAAVGLEREGRPYTPHATLGRARPGRAGAELRRVRDMQLADVFPGPAFTADRFVLMQSQLHPKGAIYTPAAHFPSKLGT
jgi:RNA 2',3'-cyclic 3'-phosphodiesterase